MLRFYKLFDLMNRRGYKKSYLRNILSSATVAKLSKGEYVSGEVIDKLCLHFHCQPGDIMEVVEVKEINEHFNLLEKPIIDKKTGKPKNLIYTEKHEDFFDKNLGENVTKSKRKYHTDEDVDTLKGPLL